VALRQIRVRLALEEEETMMRAMEMGMRTLVSQQKVTSDVLYQNDL